MNFLRQRTDFARRITRVIAVVGVWAGVAAACAEPVTFVFTSDVHLGITRGYFRGAANVEAQVVTAALAKKINALPATALPNDGGLLAGRPIGAVEFVVVTGDIANRQELHPIRIQPAAKSWAQFETSFLHVVALKNSAGEVTPVHVVPGNHDVSNAIG
ncbi:MAG: hypothetical protein RLZZ15_4066, partial [Verrucomicrobiota bacterium]